MKTLPTEIEINPRRLSGIPVLRGTRISVAQILAELGENQSAEAVDAVYDLPRGSVAGLLNALAQYFSEPSDV